MGNQTLATLAPGATFTGNVLIGGTASSFSSFTGNSFPSSVSFVSPSTGNYNLTTPSLFDSGKAGDLYIGSSGSPVANPPSAATTVAITSAGGTVTSATQTIAGTSAAPTLAPR